MGAPNKLTGKATLQREGLRGKRKPILLRMRPATHAALLSLMDHDESYDAVIERLLAQARPTRHLCV